MASSIYPRTAYRDNPLFAAGKVQLAQRRKAENDALAQLESVADGLAASAPEGVGMEMREGAPFFFALDPKNDTTGAVASAARLNQNLLPALRLWRNAKSARDDLDADLGDMPQEIEDQSLNRAIFQAQQRNVDRQFELGMDDRRQTRQTELRNRFATPMQGRMDYLAQRNRDLLRANKEDQALGLAPRTGGWAKPPPSASLAAIRERDVAGRPAPVSVAITPEGRNRLRAQNDIFNLDQQETARRLAEATRPPGAALVPPTPQAMAAREERAEMAEEFLGPPAFGRAPATMSDADFSRRLRPMIDRGRLPAETQTFMQSLIPGYRTSPTVAYNALRTYDALAERYPGPAEGAEFRQSRDTLRSALERMYEGE